MRNFRLYLVGLYVLKTSHFMSKLFKLKKLMGIFSGKFLRETVQLQWKLLSFPTRLSNYLQTNDVELTINSKPFLCHSAHVQKPILQCSQLKCWNVRSCSSLFAIVSNCKLQFTVMRHFNCCCKTNWSE